MNLDDCKDLYEKIPKKWKKYFDKDEIDKAENKIKDDLNRLKTVYPKNPFKFLEYFDPKDTKVVIVGQDPYHDGNALGYSFGVRKDKNINPSLRNIFTEVESCYYEKGERDYTLESWIKQGVLMLNKSLTVEKSVPNSHKYIWISVTRKLIERLSRRSNIVFMLWGNDARELTLYIRDGNYILESSHPSSFSANRGAMSFIGCKHFKICNDILKDINRAEITWLLSPKQIR